MDVHHIALKYLVGFFIVFFNYYYFEIVQASV